MYANGCIQYLNCILEGGNDLYTWNVILIILFWYSLNFNNFNWIIKYLKNNIAVLVFWIEHRTSVLITISISAYIGKMLKSMHTICWHVVFFTNLEN